MLVIVIVIFVWTIWILVLNRQKFNFLIFFSFIVFFFILANAVYILNWKFKLKYKYLKTKKKNFNKFYLKIIVVLVLIIITLSGRQDRRLKENWGSREERSKKMKTTNFVKTIFRVEEGVAGKQSTLTIFFHWNTERQKRYVIMTQIHFTRRVTLYVFLGFMNWYVASRSRDIEFVFDHDR